MLFSSLAADKMSARNRTAMRRPLFAASLLALAGALLAGGCASFEPSVALDLSRPQWERALARRGVVAPPGVSLSAHVPNPMEVTPEIAAVARATGGPGDPFEKLVRLQEAIFDTRQYTFEYEVTATLSAAETLRLRRGNCVSFTNLFIAFARSLGVPLRAALVKRRSSSEKKGELVVVYSHMVAVYTHGRLSTLYDFYRSRSGQAVELRFLDDLDVAGIAASNRAVEALKAGDVPVAREGLELAVRLAPRLASLQGNLGLSRLQSGDVAGALAAYRRGLELEPRNATVLHNLASYYVSVGKTGEARAALAAADEGEASAYFFLVQGDLELAGGDVEAARRSYERARRLAPKLVEPLTSLARVERARGRPAAAKKLLERAARLFPDDANVRTLLKEL